MSRSIRQRKAAQAAVQTATVERAGLIALMLTGSATALLLLALRLIGP